MAISFPTTGLVPNVTTVTSGTVTWQWNGISWDLVPVSSVSFTGLSVSLNGTINTVVVGRGGSTSASATAIGIGALANTVGNTGNNNTAVGVNALYSNTTGSNNTASGREALYSNTTGSSNTAIGFSTGLGITTGSGNTILGANVTGLAAGLANNIILADGTGAIRGQWNGTSWTFEGGGANLTGTATGFTSGASNALKSATTDVNTSVGAAPTIGQVLTATSGTTATWQSVANVTITPAVGSITGLGTNVATALGVAIGSAGAPVLFNGAGGTPSSFTLTNATGQIVAGISGGTF